MAKTRMTTAALAVCLALCCGAPARAEVTLDPDEAVFNGADEAVTLRVLADGQPVPAADITGFRLLAGGSDYRHMLRMEPGMGVVTLRPSPTAEVGSYSLAVETRGGTAWAQVYTPLSRHQTSLQALADRLHITLDELKREIGMTRDFGAPRITVEMPPVHYAGHAFRLALSEAGGVRRVWKVNGETVAEGPEAATLDHVFAEPGSYVVSCAEYQGDRRVAGFSELLEVVAEPPVLVEVAPKTILNLTGPDGFRQYSWEVDGAKAHAGQKLSQTFDAPGAHTVTATGTDPAEGNPKAFRRITYAITIK
mgnify:FL=1